MLALFSNILPFKVHSWVEEISDTYSVVNEAVDSVGTEAVGFVATEAVGFVNTETVGFVATETVDSVNNEVVVGQVGNGTSISSEQHLKLSKLKYIYEHLHIIKILTTGYVMSKCKCKM